MIVQLRIDFLRIMEREVMLSIRSFKFKLFIAFQRLQCIFFGGSLSNSVIKLLNGSTLH